MILIDNKSIVSLEALRETILDQSFDRGNFNISSLIEKEYLHFNFFPTSPLLAAVRKMHIKRTGENLIILQAGFFFIKSDRIYLLSHNKLTPRHNLLNVVKMRNSGIFING